MSQDMVKQLKNLKHSEVSPRPEWLNASRARLLSQIKNTIPTEKTGTLDNLWLGMSIFLPQKFVFNFVRPMAVLLIVALVGTSGWIATVDASYEALPGDWLYSAKRVVEKTQVTTLSILGAKISETKLHAEFAKRRASEIKGVVNSDNPDRAAVVSSVISDLKDEIQSVSNQLDEMKNSKIGGTADMAIEVQKNTDQINQSLKEVKEDLSSSTSTESQATVKEIGEAKDMAKDASVKAIEVVVAKHLDGDVTKEEVMAAIDKSMQSAVEEVSQSNQNVQSVQTVVTAANVISNAIGTTTPATEKMDNVAVKTAEAAVKTQEAVATLDKQVTEVKNLMESGNMADAVNVLKAATETTKEMDKVQDTAITTAQTVLPSPVIVAAKDQIGEANQSTGTSTEVKVIVTTTTQVIEPGKLPVTVIVTTTPATGTAGTAIQN
jgi:Domain of unknown function (DUF5667)